jgi:hypothetical protein
VHPLIATPLLKNSTEPVAPVVIVAVSVTGVFTGAVLVDALSVVVVAVPGTTGTSGERVL